MTETRYILFLLAILALATSPARAQGPADNMSFFVTSSILETAATWAGWQAPMRPASRSRLRWVPGTEPGEPIFRQIRLMRGTASVPDRGSTSKAR